MPTWSHKTLLVVTDQQRSVLNVLDDHHPHPIAYSSYGHRPRENGMLSLLGFNGELAEPLTGHYLLGNGYRAFNPVLMRFNSPDSWSPFGDGGLNAYVYCVGDPVNRADPTGHTWAWLKTMLRSIGLMRARTGTSHIATSTAAMPYRNPLANTLHPFPNTKSPAWTTQDRLAFAGSEARHPGAPRSTTSQESLITHFNDSLRSSSADIQPISTQRSSTVGTPLRRRRGADVYDAMDDDISGLRTRYGNGDLATNTARPIYDPPPNYAQSFRLPPNYGNESLPSYEQARVNAKLLENLSERQHLIRRKSL